MKHRTHKNVDSITWQEPPARKPLGRSSGKWVELLQPLVERPGTWARISVRATANSAGAFAGALKKGRVQRPPGAWEVVARGCEVYARFLGEPTAQAA